MSVDFQTVVRTIGDLPPVPAVATKVLELLGDEFADYKKLGDAISSDPAVSARLLKVANSAFYSMSRQIKTLDHAIAIVGERTLRSLVLAASLEGMNKSYGLLEKMLWEDSIGCAIGCRVLARKFSSADPEEAFLAGLFRHLGKVIMNYSNGEAYRALVEAVYTGEGSYRQLEGNYFPYAHAVVGAAVLDKWNFNRSLVMTTLHHDDLKIPVEEEEEGSRDLFRLTATVNLSDFICRKLGIGQREPDESIDVAGCPGAVALELGADDVAEAINEIDEIFTENRESFVG
ncbi:HD-like signal output (HDOD) domain, no enzymatic activity [Malonomonas rubra DSM 5091]|uniref:HD-like signal output (HDOD) domain, no enzymatic activity n=1 Tax=Malonomonas rubra DSM 5091 TaxID=1122189 RepID=A0A1M6DB35_MALRU|nr:HDOD domain-containing protein [Malonomonas rubra]SHI70369.1 HD-like signal output (HDOD) domain, no enzymatic activity [Malonomonas rubra DSM 5091]